LSAPRRLRSILALDDFEAAARRYLPRPIFGYVSGGAETTWTLKDNRAAFAEYGFVPRVLKDVSKRSQQTMLFDESYDAPFGIAPIGLGALSAYRADIVLGRAAAKANIPMIVSGSSLIRMEDVIQENPRAWFQAYLPGDPKRIAAVIERAERALFRTLVLTVDTAALANQENHIRSGFYSPLRVTPRLMWDGLMRPRWTCGLLLPTLLRHGLPHLENSHATRGSSVLARNINAEFSSRENMSWEHVEIIRKLWKGRFVLKGILHGEDARIARESGVDGVIVSNHGGRQLDGAVAPLRALESVMPAAGGMTVMLDGGVRRGSDVLKALALGAKFVFIGRPLIYAAAIGGEPGVLHAVKLLREEIHRNMALLGINRLSEVGPEYLLRLRRD
jgi:L-lactate dehydrogenase (cytochrome)